MINEIHSNLTLSIIYPNVIQQKKKKKFIDASHYIHVFKNSDRNLTGIQICKQIQFSNFLVVQK